MRTKRRKKLLALLLETLDDGARKKIITIPIRAQRGAEAFADYMVVASGTSHRHVGSLAQKVMEIWKHEGGIQPHAEGMPHCDWVLVDGGAIVLHLFRPEVRDYYNLENMWETSPLKTKPDKSP